MDSIESLWDLGFRLVTIPASGRLVETQFARSVAASVGTSSNLGLAAAVYCDLRWSRGEDEIVERVSQAAGFDFSVGMPEGAESDAIGEALAGRDQLLLVLVGLDVTSSVVASTVGKWLQAAPSLRVVVTAPGPLGLEAEAVLPFPGDGGSPPPPPDETAASLTPELRRVLDCLSVFRGGFGLEAAAAVAGLSSPEQTAEALQGLADSSLLEWAEGTPASGTVRRAFLCGSIEAGAADSGEEHSLLESAFARHRDYFVGAERLALFESGGPEEGLLRWVLAERENLLAVQGRFATTDPKAAAEAVLTVAQAMFARGPFAASYERLGAAIDGLSDSAPGALRTRLELARGAAGVLGSKPEPGARHLETARALASAAGRSDLESDALEHLGQGALRAGHLQEAQTLLKSAATTAVKGGHGELAARSFCSLGVALEAAGDFEGAEVALREATDQATKAGSVGQQLRCRSKLGAHYYFLNRWDDAAEHLRWSFEQGTERGALFLAACSGYNLGRLSLNLGHLEEADTVLHTALLDFSIVGNRTSEAYVRIELGVLHLERGELGLAREHLMASLEQLAPLRHILIRVYAQLTLAQVALAADQLAEARAWHEQCLGATVRLKHQPLEGLVHCIGAVIEFAAGATEACGAARDRASELLENTRWAEGRGLLALAEAFAGGELDEEAVRTQARARASLPLLGTTTSPRSAPSAAYLTGPRVLPPMAMKPGWRLRVEREGRWFEVSGAERVDLGRKRTLRPLLKTLIESRRAHPGLALDVDGIFTAVWPGEFCLPDARKNRVYVAVAALRKMGLDRALITRGDGYLLPADLDMEVLDPP